MLGYIATFILIFIAWLSRLIYRNIINPISIFCLEWAAICFLAALRLFGLLEADINTWLIVITGCISYIVGCWLANRVGVSTGACQVNFSDFLFSKKISWFLLISVCVFISKDFIQTLYFMSLGYDLDEIRLATYNIYSISGFVNNSGGTREYLNTIFGTIRFLVIVNCIIIFVKDVNKNKGLMCMALLVELMFSFAQGGRFELAYFIIETYIAYKFFSFKKQNTDGKKIGRYVVCIIGILSFMMLCITLMRGAVLGMLSEKLYRYICGNIIFLDIHLNEIDLYDISSLGMTTLYGFFSLLMPVLNKLGIAYPSIYLYSVGIIEDTQVFRYIGGEMYTNAFITPFYYLYADFGYLGVILGMIAFGFCAMTIYNDTNKGCSATKLCWYLIVVQMVFKSLQFYPTVSREYCLLMVIYIFSNFKFKKIN